MGCCMILGTVALLQGSRGARGSRAVEPVAGCDLESPALSKLALLRSGAARWYQSGVFELSDVDLVVSTLETRATLLATCPVAVLQALLLKLEENLVYEPLAFQELMGAYTLYLQEAVQAGTISAEDLRQWPLQEGVERVLSASRELAARRSLTSAMVMNYCQPADRFGTIHELDWLLAPPFGEPGVEPDAGLLTDTDLFIYLVDAPWCKQLDPQLVARLERAVRAVHLIPYTGGPGREEQTAYFKFLVDHYDSLPDFTIFVHPDAPEHQGVRFPALRRALKLIRTQSEFAHEAIGYYPLAEQMVVDPKRAWGTGYTPSWHRFWRHVFGHSWRDHGFAPPQCKWKESKGTYISGAVDGHEDRLWRPAAKALCASTPSCAGVTCRTPTDVEDLQTYIQDVRGNPSCTLRRGDAGPEPLPSPSELETSFPKRCAEEGSSGHEDADLRVPVPADDDRPAVFSRHKGAYLAEHAGGDAAPRPLRLARARCGQLGVLCGGVTCDPEEVSCTVRAGAELLSSPYGEVSWLKDPRGAGGEPGELAPVVDAVPEASGVFQFYTGSQSVVRRDRLRAWARERLAAFGSEGEFCSEMSGYYEAAWHRMFGEPLSQWPRESDPRLPLYLKWGVHTKYSYGDEGVI